MNVPTPAEMVERSHRLAAKHRRALEAVAETVRAEYAALAASGPPGAAEGPQ